MWGAPCACLCFWLKLKCAGFFILLFQTDCARMPGKASFYAFDIVNIEFREATISREVGCLVHSFMTHTENTCCLPRSRPVSCARVDDKTKRLPLFFAFQVEIPLILQHHAPAVIDKNADFWRNSWNLTIFCHFNQKLSFLLSYHHLY